MNGSDNASFLVDAQGNSLGANTNILNPNLPFEWATLLSNYPKFIP